MGAHRKKWTAQADGRLPLPNSKFCFICGEDNKAGLRTRFFVEGEQVKMPFYGRVEHCGFPGTVHGGVTAAALDECMGWAAARALGRFCVTAELSIRYIRPVPTERDLTVVAELTEWNRRMARASGALVDAEGVEYARATGRFFPMTEEATLEVEQLLLYHEGDLHLFGDGQDRGGG